MPSPLNGLTLPAASPMTRYVGPAFGPTEPPIGMRPLVALHSGWSVSISHRSATWWAYASSRCVVLTLLKSRNVDSRPTPMLTVPSPTGKIQP